MSIVSKMTTEEKIKLVCGADFWHSSEIERLGIRSYSFSDGPYGIRKQEGENDHLGLNESIKAICFPTGSALGASFNKKLIERQGQLLGQFARQENIDVLLGPSMNIKRSPLCGRNFEYFSEDPYVTGELASAYIKGVQSRGIAACPKHFALNNQEYYRMTSSSNADERTMREIYLKAFEKVVREAMPLTIMTSYNKINGIYASDNKYLLKTVLRDEWEFSGVVVSDWGGTNHRSTNLKAGLDISMPNSLFLEKQLATSLSDGTITESDLDYSCNRILELDKKISTANHHEKLTLDRGYQEAKLIANETIVLLRNEDVLPLNIKEKVLFIGPFAENPRFQGGGSSHINSYRPTSSLDSVPTNAKVDFIEGYSLNDDENQVILKEETLKKAACYNKVVLFAGLPDNYESEGYDREHLNLPQQQLDLIDGLADLACKVIIVLHNGSPVEIPFAEKVEGIIEAYLSGEAVGEVVSDILFGKVNPSGRLAETFPLKIQDTPTYLTYGKAKENVYYHEGLFVGYRYYNSKQLPVRYPFGYGLSYTKFDYKQLELLHNKKTGNYDVSVSVTNIGDMDGKEVIQLYVEHQDSQIVRAKRELKGFEKIGIKIGETERVEFTLPPQTFSHWSNENNCWQTEGGKYKIQIGKNSDEIILEDTVEIPPSKKQILYSMDTVLGDILENEKSAKIFGKLFSEFTDSPAEKRESSAISNALVQETMKTMPLRALLNYTQNISESDVKVMLDKMNGQV